MTIDGVLASVPGVAAEVLVMIAAYRLGGLEGVAALCAAEGAGEWCGMLKRRLVRLFSAPTLVPRGLGLRLLKLPIGLANPLLRPMASNTEEAGVTTAI